jgi:carboxymethylenebutenolidase
LRSTTGAPQIAAVGFGFGGGWSLQTAIDAGDAIDAAVIISGQVSDDESMLDALQDPVLGIFAEHDNVVPSESVAKFEATLGKLGKSGEIEMIADAKRGFADPMSPNYDAELAAQGWSRMVKFLNEALGDSGS